MSASIACAYVQELIAGGYLLTCPRTANAAGAIWRSVVTLRKLAGSENGTPDQNADSAVIADNANIAEKSEGAFGRSTTDPHPVTCPQ
jgi:hypothetical protein